MVRAPPGGTEGENVPDLSARTNPNPYSKNAGGFPLFPHISSEQRGEGCVDEKGKDVFLFVCFLEI